MVDLTPSRLPSQRAPLPSEAETRTQARPGGAMDASVELAHKQALIDRLLDDVDKRANAVARCGQETTALRLTPTPTPTRPHPNPNPNPSPSPTPKQEIMELRALNRHQEQELQAQRAAAVGRERAIERCPNPNPNPNPNPDPDPDPNPTPNPDPKPSPNPKPQPSPLTAHLSPLTLTRLADDAANVDNIDMVELQRRHRLLAAAYRADRKRIEQLQAPCMQ